MHGLQFFYEYLTFSRNGFYGNDQRENIKLMAVGVECILWKFIDTECKDKFMKHVTTTQSAPQLRNGGYKLRYKTMKNLTDTKVLNKSKRIDNKIPSKEGVKGETSVPHTVPTKEGVKGETSVPPMIDESDNTWQAIINEINSNQISKAALEKSDEILKSIFQKPQDRVTTYLKSDDRKNFKERMKEEQQKLRDLKDK